MDISIFISIGSVLIALGSLVVACLAYLRTKKVDRENTINNKKALIRAIVYKSGNLSKMRVWNDGNATAKNIRINLRDNCLYIRTLKNLFPYPLLNKGDNFEVCVEIGDIKSIPILKFIWDDDFKRDNEREQVLDF